jgi:hypothetical protein
MDFIGACGMSRLSAALNCTGPVPVLGIYVCRNKVTQFIWCVRHVELGHWEVVDTIALPSALGLNRKGWRPLATWPAAGASEPNFLAADDEVIWHVVTSIAPGASSLIKEEDGAPQV